MRAVVQVVTPPARFPITLAEFKAHNRNTDTVEDALIEQYVEAAGRFCAEWQNSTYIDTVLTATFPRFPVAGCPLELPRGPASAIASVAYIDTAGSTNVLVDGTDYLTAPEAFVPEVRPRPSDGTWPQDANRYRADVVTVTYTAGYGATAEHVPAEIRQAVAITAGHFYRARDEHAELPEAIERILSLKRRF